jgi:hypothetical protein
LARRLVEKQGARRLQIAGVVNEPLRLSLFMNPIIQSPSAKKYVLGIRKKTAQEVVFQAAPRRVSRAKALRAWDLGRFTHKILSKRKNTQK